MSARVLVTGAQGFVGVYLVAELLRRGTAERVAGIGRGARRDAPFAQPVRSARYAYAALDIADTERLAGLIGALRPTLVFHLASGLRDDPPAALFRTNVEGTLSLFAAIERAGIDPPRVVLGSSGGVYGIPERLPIGEEDRCRPVDLYSASKLAAEHAAAIVARAGGIPLFVARLFNLIGPGQDERHACARFAAQLAAVAAGGAAARIEVGDLSPTRDFVDVRDVAAALVLLAERGIEPGAYNVASGVETSIRTLLDTTVRAARAGAALELRATYRRAADIPRHVADLTKLRALGYEPAFGLADGVAELVRFYATGAAATAPADPATTSATSAGTA